MTTDRGITIFNLRLDKATRRELYIPTNIANVSFYEIDSSRYSKGDRAEALTCKIRIPINAVVESGRTYIPEGQYKALSDEEALKHWTLQKGDQILAADSAYTDAWRNGGHTLGREYPQIDQRTLEEIRQAEQYTGPLISIAEYADNTLRGSQAVKHWRIGGA